MRPYLTHPLIALLVFSSCAKEDDTPLTPVPAPPSCGINGLRLEATFDGNAFCANASLFAAQGAAVVTISGIDQQARTLTLELDSIQVGDHPISAGTNAILFTTQLGIPYSSHDASVGTLTISSHDPTLRRLSGSFSTWLRSEGLPGPPKELTGSFDVTYVD